MEKKIRIFDYADREKEITIEDFENVKYCFFEIISGDGILTVVYKNKNREEVFGSSDNRLQDFHDGSWIIAPENIDVLNRMKNHYDTDELEKLTLFEKWKNFIYFVDAPAKARLLDCEWKDGLEQYDYFKTEIENALKNYDELTNKPVMFCRSTHGSKQALIDMICKNHKEVKITCLEDEKKLKALETIKEVILEDLVFDDKEQEINFSFGVSTLCIKIEDKTKYDLLKEALL